MAKVSQSAQDNLNKLIAQLNKTPTYQPIDPGQMRTMAQNKYASTYNQNRLAAQQNYETQTQALDRQLSDLGRSFDQQREDTQKQYEQQYAQTARGAVKDNMQRSSYLGTQLAGVAQAGIDAQARLNESQLTQEGALTEKKTEAATKLAQDIAEANVSEQKDISDYMDELEQREYDRTQKNEDTLRQNAMSIYELQHQLEWEAEQRDMFDAQLAAMTASNKKR